MKYFVATDIHGSAYWAKKVADKFVASGADLLVLLGDVYNHGPRNPFPQDYAPMKVAEIFNALSGKIVAVQGNCDSEVDQMISTFPFVREEILPFGGHRILFTHGHVHNKDNVGQLIGGDVMMYGHFHVNEVNVNGGVTCVALSSCSLPKNNCVPAYAVCNEKTLTVYDFDDKVLNELTF